MIGGKPLASKSIVALASYFRKPLSWIIGFIHYTYD